MGEAEQEPESRESVPSDRSLLQRFRAGSQDAATQLYARYAHRLRGLAQAQCSPDLARRVEADEIVQSVFGSFFRAAREGYYDLPAGEELWKLFLIIALNKIRARGAYHRAARRDLRRSVGGEWIETTPEAVAQTDDAACAWLQLTVDDALEHLPEQHRQIVQLRMEGHGVAEIAEQTGRSKRTTERLLQESRRRLAELLDVEDESS